MPRPDEVACDACSAAFTPNLRERPDGEGAVLQVMVCPWCAAEYPIARITRRGLDLRDKLARELRRYHRDVKGHPDPDRLWAETVEPVKAAYAAECTRVTAAR